MTARFLTSCASRDWLLSVPVILSKHRFRRESVSAGVLIISMCERGRIDPPKAGRGYTTYVNVDTSLVPKICYAPYACSIHTHIHGRSLFVLIRSLVYATMFEIRVLTA